MSDQFEPSAPFTDDEARKLVEESGTARRAFTAFLATHWQTLETLAAQAKRYAELFQEQITPEMVLAAERLTRQMEERMGLRSAIQRRPPEPPPAGGGLLN